MLAPEDWKNFLNQVVVVDTDSSFVYLGTLAKVGEQFVQLKDLDAHDTRETPTTKERYVMDSKRFGVKANRKEISIRHEKIVSLSLLQDVIEY